MNVNKAQQEGVSVFKVSISRSYSLNFDKEELAYMIGLHKCQFSSM